MTTVLFQLCEEYLPDALQQAVGRTMFPGYRLTTEKVEVEGSAQEREMQTSGQIAPTLETGLWG